MKSQPLVSYLVPSYNHEKFVTQTLDSLVTDNYPLKEIILIDDGSNDRSYALIEKWKLENPDVNFKSLSRPNRGVSATLNELIDSSHGEFIRFCASDDLIIPGSTARLVRRLQVSKKAAIFGDCTVIDQAGHEIASSSIEFKHGCREEYSRALSRAIIGNWAIVGPSILYARKAFEKKRFDEALTVEDWDFYLRLLAAQELSFVDETVARYRIHGTNTSITSSRETRLRNLDSQLKAAQKNIAIFSPPEKWQLLAQSWLLRAKICYLRSNFIIGVLFLIGYHLLSRMAVLLAH